MSITFVPEWQSYSKAMNSFLKKEYEWTIRLLLAAHCDKKHAKVGTERRLCCSTNVDKNVKEIECGFM